ncbi:MAG: F0F1 ATP synthase subunit B' [Geminicoccaceae bacterium]|nr:MAG: F0F1 ATP synthase subunit B' [Geminicoccaceae bacterium]
MPQLDGSTFPSQVLWLVVAFGVLTWLMATRGVPRVADILETRQDRIAADLDRAQALRTEAEKAMQEQQAMIADAQARARTALLVAQEKSAAEAARRERELEESLQHQLKEAEARIQAARTQALSELEAVATEVSRAASGHLLGLDISAEEAAQAVASARQGAQ